MAPAVDETFWATPAGRAFPIVKDGSIEEWGVLWAELYPPQIHMFKYLPAPNPPCNSTS